MKLKLIPIQTGLSVALTVTITAALALAVSTLSTRAQNVNVTTSLSGFAAGGGVYDYTLTLNNTGPEAIESFWLGWVPGSFNVANPSNPGNNLGWSSSLDGSSVEYLGTYGTALPAGYSGTFTFDSTTTPAQFLAETGKAGDSTAYGVSAYYGQLSFTLSPPDTETFYLTVAPEPSTLALLALGSLPLGLLRMRLLRRKS